MLDREHFKSNKFSLCIANSEPGISGCDLQVQPKVCDHNLVIPDKEQLIVFQFPFSWRAEQFTIMLMWNVTREWHIALWAQERLIT